MEWPRSGLSAKCGVFHRNTAFSRGAACDRNARDGAIPRRCLQGHAIGIARTSPSPPSCLGRSAHARIGNARYGPCRGASSSCPGDDGKRSGILEADAAGPTPAPPNGTLSEIPTRCSPGHVRLQPAELSSRRGVQAHQGRKTSGRNQVVLACSRTLQRCMPEGACVTRQEDCTTRFSMKNSIIRSVEIPECPWSGPTCSSKLLPAACSALTSCSVLFGCTLLSAVP